MSDVLVQCCEEREGWFYECVHLVKGSECHQQCYKCQYGNAYHLNSMGLVFTKLNISGLHNTKVINA